MILWRLYERLSRAPVQDNAGMSWDTDGEKVYIYQYKVLVMVLSVSEVTDIRKHLFGEQVCQS